MSLPDPLLLNNDSAIPAPQVYSPEVGTTLYRRQDAAGVATYKMSQTDNGKRVRHVVRHENAWEAHKNALTGVRPSSTVTITIDEPAGDVIPDADLLFQVNGVKTTLTDAIINRLLNGEL
jgi:hypothetical protein